MKHLLSAIALFAAFSPLAINAQTEINPTGDYNRITAMYHIATSPATAQTVSNSDTCMDSVFQAPPRSSFRQV